MDCNISTMNGTPITIKGKWHHKYKRHNAACRKLGKDEQDPFLGPLDPWTSLHVTSTYRDM
jgi:hypothetical protein